MANGYNVGTAYVQVMPSANGISGAISKAIGAESRDAGEKGGKSLVSAMKKVIAVAGVGKAIWSSISAGADLQQSIGGIETLYKDSADKMMEYANQAYLTSGVSANDYMQQVTSYSAGLIKSLGGDTDKAVESANQAMIDMADNANKLGTPIESIQYAYQGFAKQNYSMLDNLKLGYGGSRKEMERLLKDAQKITGVKYDINNLSDVYEAIHVIQTDLGITGTTAKEAQETISGSIQMMKASYQDFIANLALGNDVTPQIEALMKSIVVMAKNVIPAIANVIIGIPKVIIKNWPKIVKAVTDGAKKLVIQWGMFKDKWLSQGSDMIMNIAKGLIQRIPQFLVTLGQIIQRVGQFIFSNIPTILAYVGKMLGQLSMYLLQQTPSIIKAVFKLAGSLIKTAINGIGNIIKGLWVFVKNSFTASPIVAPFVTAYNKIKALIDKIKAFFPISIGKIFKNIQLPTFNLFKGNFDKGVAPRVSVVWKAKGGIMNQPTLFGGGEAGPEAIVPLDPFWKTLDEKLNTGVTINVYANEGMSVMELAKAVEDKIIQAQKRRTLAWQ